MLKNALVLTAIAALSFASPAIACPNDPGNGGGGTCPPGGQLEGDSCPGGGGSCPTDPGNGGCPGGDK